MRSTGPGTLFNYFTDLIFFIFADIKFYIFCIAKFFYKDRMILKQAELNCDR